MVTVLFPRFAQVKLVGVNETVTVLSQTSVALVTTSDSSKVTVPPALKLTVAFFTTKTGAVASTTVTTAV